MLPQSTMFSSIHHRNDKGSGLAWVTKNRSAAGEAAHFSVHTEVCRCKSVSHDRSRKPRVLRGDGGPESTAMRSPLLLEVPSCLLVKAIARGAVACAVQTRQVIIADISAHEECPLRPRAIKSAMIVADESHMCGGGKLRQGDILWHRWC